MSRRVMGIVAGLGMLGATAIGCDRAPASAGLPEWSTRDHDGEKSTKNQGPRGDGGQAPSLVEIAWRQQCASCHGPGGRGDGPQGPMFKATDLTNAAWQSKVDDVQIASAIKNGKGRMPKFDLPDDVVAGLVARVRTFRGQ